MKCGDKNPLPAIVCRKCSASSPLVNVVPEPSPTVPVPQNFDTVSTPKSLKQELLTPVKRIGYGISLLLIFPLGVLLGMSKFQIFRLIAIGLFVLFPIAMFIAVPLLLYGSIRGLYYTARLRSANTAVALGWASLFLIGLISGVAVLLFALWFTFFFGV